MKFGCKPPWTVHKRQAPPTNVKSTFWRQFWSGVGQKIRLRIPVFLGIRLHPKTSDSLQHWTLLAAKRFKK